MVRIRLTEARLVEMTDSADIVLANAIAITAATNSNAPSSVPVKAAGQSLESMVRMPQIVLMPPAASQTTTASSVPAKSKPAAPIIAVAADSGVAPSSSSSRQPQPQLVSQPQRTLHGEAMRFDTPSRSRSRTPGRSPSSPRDDLPPDHPTALRRSFRRRRMGYLLAVLDAVTHELQRRHPGQ